MSEPLRFPDKYFELFPQAQRLPTETLMNVVHLARLVTDGYERIARAEGLSASGVETLRLLALAGGPLTPAELATSEFLSTATMTTVLATLERRGLVKRSPHPTDGRKVLMSTTPAAAEVLSRIMDRYLSFGHELMTTLSERDLTRLQHLTIRLLAAVDSGPLDVDHTGRAQELSA